MSNPLTPVPIIDKNGHATTRNKNLNDGSEAAQGRSAAAPAPTPTATAVSVITSYQFVSEIPSYKNAEFFDVRDVADIFDSYAVEIDEHIESFDAEDENTLEFDESDEGVEDMKNEARKWAKIIDELDVDNADSPVEPVGNGMREWSDYVFGISKALKAVSDNDSPTLTSEFAMEERVEEFAKDVGDIPSDLPTYIANNINWADIAKQRMEEAKEAQVDGVQFYLA